MGDKSSDVTSLLRQLEAQGRRLDELEDGLRQLRAAGRRPQDARLEAPPSGQKTPPATFSRESREHSKSPCSRPAADPPGSAFPWGAGVITENRSHGCDDASRGGGRGEAAAFEATGAGGEPHAGASVAAPIDAISVRKMLNQDFRVLIYDKPYRKAGKRGALVGGGIMGLLSVPFGPIGMAGCGVLGAVCGAAVGWAVDKRYASQQLAASEIEKRRLKSLIRWVCERFHRDEDVLRAIEMVTLEFKPVADIVAGSENARRLLRLLDRWISQRHVTRNLWVYMDVILQNWRRMSPEDLAQSMHVLQTLRLTLECSKRNLSEAEFDFLRRATKILNHTSVHQVLTRAVEPTPGNKRVMESLVFADAAKNTHERRASFGSPSPARTPRPGSPAAYASPHNLEEGLDSDDSSNDLQSYRFVATPRGKQMVPEERNASEEEEQGAVEAPSRPVLKKPFFKSWDDFMQFDTTVKQKMPITLSEFDLLLEKETESTAAWEVPVQRSEITVAKIQQGPLVALRAWATVPGVKLNVAFYLFFTHEERVKWDKVFATMRMVQPIVDGSDILYSLMKAPVVTPREFLQYRRVRILDDGSIALVLRSAEHPDAPVDSRYIRADSLFAGYVMRQEYDEGGAPVLKLFLTTCLDIKGLIPKWVVNSMAPRKPPEWVETLRKVATEYQRDHPNCDEELQRTIDQFKCEIPFDYEVPPRASSSANEGQM